MHNNICFIFESLFHLEYFEFFVLLTFNSQIKSYVPDLWSGFSNMETKRKRRMNSVLSNKLQLCMSARC